MTAPISFPSIAPPQLAPRAPNTLDDLPQLILAFAQHRDAIAHDQAALELERQRTEASVAEAGAATANSKQDLKDKQQAFDQKAKIMQAHDIVANELPGVLTQPGDFTQNAEGARVRLIQQNKQLAPYINDAFNSQIQDVSKARTAIADRRIAEANAPVAEQTAAPKIAQSKSEARRAAIEEGRAATEAETAKVQLHLSQMDAQYGQGRSAIATSVIAGGGTLGQAYRISGVPIPAGVDPNWTTNKGAANAAQTRQSDYVNLMTDALPGMEKLYKKADAKAVSAMIKFPIALNGVGDANTQEYVSNARDFLAGVLHEESGARLNDAQLAWGIGRYIIIGGDSPREKEAKMERARAVTAARKKDINFRVPGAPYSDEAAQTFGTTPPKANGVSTSVSDRFQTGKPPQ